MYIHDEETHCFFKHLKQTSGQIPADKKLIVWIGSWDVFTHPCGDSARCFSGDHVTFPAMFAATKTRGNIQIQPLFCRLCCCFQYSLRIWLIRLLSSVLCFKVRSPFYKFRSASLGGMNVRMLRRREGRGR